MTVIAENSKVLNWLVFSFPLLMAGGVVIVGIIRKWRFFTEPLPMFLDCWRFTVSIHKRFGAKGMKAFWLVVAIAGIAMSIFAFMDVVSTNN